MIKYYDKTITFGKVKMKNYALLLFKRKKKKATKTQIQTITKTKPNQNPPHLHHLDLNHCFSSRKKIYHNTHFHKMVLLGINKIIKRTLKMH